MAKPNAKAVETYDSVRRLADYLHDEVTQDMTNGYTALAARHNVNASSFKVKDGRSAKLLRVIIMEEEE